MFEILRRHCFLLAVGVLLWQGWSAGQADAAPVAAGTEPPPPPARLSADDLPLRPDAAARLAPEDPFFLAQLLAMREQEQAMREVEVFGGAPAAANDGVVLEGAPGAPALRLILQSTMPGATGRAWINGADVGVGEIIPHADAEQPPVLLEVGGTGVLVEWRGRRYRLDLDGGAPVAEELR